MNASAWIPLLAAVVAGLVALIGYSLTQYATVSAVYDDLVDRTRQLGRDHLRAAWAGKVIRRDTEMIGTAAPFDWPGIDAKLDLCILAMRQELSFWGFKSRRSRQGSLGQTTSEKGGGKRQ